MEGYGTMKTHEEFQVSVKPSRDQQAANNRAAFPECSAAVDLMRELFGDDVQVLAMSEGGKEIKPKNYKAVDDYSMWMSGTRFIELGAQCRRAEEYAKGRDKNAK
jgi:hypothetical protein